MLEPDSWISANHETIFLEEYRDNHLCSVADGSLPISAGLSAGGYDLRMGNDARIIKQRPKDRLECWQNLAGLDTTRPDDLLDF